MKGKRGFPPHVLAAIDEGKILGIRAGTPPHRVIGIWAVVVEGRVFVRSWSLKPRSWYRTFLKEPRGAVNVGGREIPVRAVRTRSERLKDPIDRAYLEKYRTPGSIKYARDLGPATGTTLHGYREQFRLRAALESLASESADLTALALDLGYSSHSHFTTRFRRAFGVQPSRVRGRLARGLLEPWPPPRGTSPRGRGGSGMPGDA